MKLFQTCACGTVCCVLRLAPAWRCRALRGCAFASVSGHSVVALVLTCLLCLQRLMRPGQWLKQKCQSSHNGSAAGCLRQFCGCRHGYFDLVATTVSADGRSDRWTGINDGASTISCRSPVRADPCGRVDAPTSESNWNPDEPASDYPGYFFSLKQVTEVVLFKALTKYVGKPLRVPRLVVQRKTSSHKSGRLLDCCSGSRQPSMRSRRAMCLSFEERRISARWTLTG